MAGEPLERMVELSELALPGADTMATTAAGWSGYNAVRSLVVGERYDVALNAMDVALARARRRAEDEEREQVAAEVRDAIARSGLSRAEFASRIGTSSSRLSTYATGKVTPSASLMVRMRRVAAQGESATSAPACT
jgi:DNA-binding transcriptional regulator YiaG